MRWLIPSLVLIGLSTTVQAGSSQKFYNAKGQMTGGTTTNNNNVTTFRDSMGKTGTATTNNNGVTTFRDGMGRTTGTSTRVAEPLTQQHGQS